MATQGDPQLVYSVENVTYMVTWGVDMAFVVSAEGTASSGGWSSPTLNTVVYTQPPADGVQEFTFTAVPPDGAASAAMTPIEADGGGCLVEAWMKGLRVIAETNSKEIPVG